ncbi:hypothetical protein LINPERPRIM_LOCUS2489 [Linum perenne]
MPAGMISDHLREGPRPRVAPTAVRRACKTSDRRKDDSGGERRGSGGAAETTTRRDGAAATATVRRRRRWHGGDGDGMAATATARLLRCQSLITLPGFLVFDEEGG